jgi:hypothetical protein
MAVYLVEAALAAELYQHVNDEADLWSQVSDLRPYRMDVDRGGPIVLGHGHEASRIDMLPK